MPRGSTTGNRKIRAVMREYKHGELRSSSGAKVRKREQAVAIALSEARQAGAQIPGKRSPSYRRGGSARRHR
jgi:hypothetical protein